MDILQNTILTLKQANFIKQNKKNNKERIRKDGE